MTRQIINVGTGPDSYTGEPVRTAFQKINDNFAQLYAGNVGGNIIGNTITANNFITAGNLSAGNIEVQGGLVTLGNLTANYIFGNLQANIQSANIDPGIWIKNSGTIYAHLYTATTPYDTTYLITNVNPSTNRLVIGSAANSTIQFNSNNGKIDLTGDTISSGYISAQYYVANTSSQSGYTFSGLGLTGLNHATEGSSSVLQLSHDTVQVIKIYDNNTTQIVGNLEIRATVNDASTFPNAFIKMNSNIASYAQFVAQNKSNSPLASSDIILTSDNGNDSSYFGDFGIASSTYNYPGYGIIKPNDVYLLAVSDDITGPGSSDSGNLILGTTNGNITMFVGAPEEANVIARVSTTGVNLTQGNLTIAQGNAPSTASSAGTAGQIAWDSGYVYVCVATNTWKRANLSTW